MAKKQVLVLGSTGMLGSAVYHKLTEHELGVIEASRSTGLFFDAEFDPVEPLLQMASLSPGDYVVNCIGLTKTHINEQDLSTLERAVKLNALLPIELARAAEELGLRVIQVATDCVFSGGEGKYSESSPHNAIDVYGKTKSIGEVKSEHFMHLRSSLVGPEGKGKKSLFFEWVRAAEPHTVLKGYVNHHWNGLTSLAFSRIVAGIIARDQFIAGLHHLVPADEITKHELIRLELEFLEREHVRLEAFEAEEAIDRTLATDLPERNSSLFAFGGYEHVPTIREMMEELPWEALRES